MSVLKNYKLEEGLFIAVAFAIPFLPFTKVALTILMILILIERITYYVYLKKKPDAFQKGNLILLLFASFWVVHLLGMLYTNNSTKGWLNIETKIPFFFFAVIFLFYPSLSNNSFHKIALSFIIACLVIGSYLLLNALHSYNTNLQFRSFFYTQLSSFHHPSYLAMYFNLCILFLIYFLDKKVLANYNLFFSMLIIYFSVFILLLESKSGILSLILSLLILGIIYLKKKKYKPILVFLSFIIGITITYICIVPVQSNRIYSAIKESNHNTGSIYTRFLIWKSISENIPDTWIYGVGTGDVDPYLSEQYKKQEAVQLSTAIEKKYNAHNQYLQTFVALGLIGVLILTCCLLFPLYLSIKQRDYLYSCFIVVIAINLMFESMFERQAGIVFYAFFNTVLFKRLVNRTNEPLMYY